MSILVEKSYRVLDHGHVILVNHLGTDLSVVQAARVSHQAQWRSGEDENADEKLIRYMMRHGHTSPFEHVVVTFEVKAPIFVYRQWHRHRTWSYNEVSARYSRLSDEYYLPLPGIVGKQASHNKQARTIDGDFDDHVEKEIIMLKSACERSMAVYYSLLSECNWPRELARLVLPVNTYSSMFATIDLHNLFKFLELRADPHAQFEIRQYAIAMYHLVFPIAPTCCLAWYDLRASEAVQNELMKEPLSWTWEGEG